jgi:alkanesulfonate monooxygenase SsuD/methylene tetrahydromethanopterin reductase-like flavin-dependent oxidoreductase (luciferase family)
VKQEIAHEVAMKFSMIFEAQLANPTPAREQQLIHDCIEQAVYGEEMGFDGVWAVEHHALKRYAHMSAPEIFLTAVAARTKRIRIGHGVVCMAFNYNYPTRVAERAAMLDIISKGRLNLGAGRGGTAQEASLNNVDRDATYAEVEESLKIIGKVWQDPDGFEWEGDLLTIKSPPGAVKHSVVPSPIQLPHPPLFMACTRPDTVSKAAEYGIGALVFGFGGLDSIRDQKRLYDETIRTRSGDGFVSTVVNDHFCALCPTIVLDDRAKAKEIGARGQRFFAEAIGQWARPGAPQPHEDTEGVDNVAWMAERKTQILEAAKHDPELAKQATLAVASYNLDHAYGDANDAIAYVQELVDTGADEIMCLIQMGTVPHEICMETIKVWGEKIIPYFREQRQRAAA